MNNDCSGSSAFLGQDDGQGFHSFLTFILLNAAKYRRHSYARMDVDTQSCPFTFRPESTMQPITFSLSSSNRRLRSFVTAQLVDLVPQLQDEHMAHVDASNHSLCKNGVVHCPKRQPNLSRKIDDQMPPSALPPTPIVQWHLGIRSRLFHDNDGGEKRQYSMGYGCVPCAFSFQPSNVLHRLHSRDVIHTSLDFASGKSMLGKHEREPTQQTADPDDAVAHANGPLSQRGYHFSSTIMYFMYGHPHVMLNCHKLFLSDAL